MPREKAPKKKVPRRPKKWSSPREMYIYDPSHPTINQVAEAFKGLKGCGRNYIANVCTQDKWRKFRDEHWAKVDEEVARRQVQQQADERERQIAEAGDRHVKVGQVLQGAAGVAVEAAVQVVRDYKANKVEAKEAMRAMAMLVPQMTKGVEVERKGLGIMDMFVVATHTREIATKVLVVIQKYVKDAAVYENIVKDLSQIETDARVPVDELLEGK